MLAAFKEFVLPLLVYFVVLGGCLVGLLKSPRVPLLLFVFLVSLPSFWYPTHQFPLGKDTMDLLFWSAIFGLVRKQELRWPERGWLVLAAVLYGYFSLWLLSRNFGLAAPLTTEHPVLADWKNYAMMALWFFVAYSAVNAVEDAKYVVAVMIGVLLFMCWREISGFVAGSSFSWTRRAEGPFWIVGLNSNHFGAFIAQVSLLAMGAAAYETRKARRIILWATVGLSLYPLLYSYSRGAYLAYLAGLLVLGALRYRWLIPAGVVLLFVWQVALPESVVERISMTENEDGELEKSAALRIQMWAIATRLFGENPITGIGMNGFFFVTEGLELRNVHNYYYQVAAEQGAIGVALLLSMLLAALRIGWRVWRRHDNGFQKGVGLGLMGYTVAVAVANVFGDRFSQLALGSYFFVLMGVGAALLRLQTQREAARVERESAPARAALHPGRV